MKFPYALIGITLNVALTFTIPIIVKITATCLYFISSFLGYEDGADIRGDESVFIIVLLLTLLLLGWFFSSLYFGNRYVYRKLKIRLGYYLVLCCAILLTSYYFVEQRWPL
ncbi:hypothetical protein [Paenibacillus xanthanilyticus]|uniref:DUF3397 domain-containing protein n=1 Tax=Paenibacillus xanthanilyticus TaxID=1783531 RepID=A0ABV8K6M0_9BACL